ncbi:unnamed protein product [Didymodactylos carnosus]|uniref:J domain-containing protein n=1 Tax=Didymodactylos carnosus TaxID=1234261 RepID=A0A814KAG1_9BILA|nr:unnamed protein product [Didymodactylos carnosus]CAF3818029.1 unnamed protein product [Didymodactylos carnosus]
MVCKNNKVNYYDVLNIQQDAKSHDIRRKYKELALLWHPDRNKTSNAEEKFKLIKQAYEILSDEQKRKEYDEEQLRQKNVASTHCTTSTTGGRDIGILRFVHTSYYTKFFFLESTGIYSDDFTQYFQPVHPTDIVIDFPLFSPQIFDNIFPLNEFNLFNDIKLCGETYFVPEMSKSITREIFSRLLSNFPNFTSKNHHFQQQQSSNNRKFSDRINKMPKEKHLKSHPLFPDPIYRESKNNQYSNNHHQYHHRHSKPTSSASVYQSPSIQFFDLPLVFPENFFDEKMQLNEENNLFKVDPYNFFNSNDLIQSTIYPSQLIFEQQNFSTTDSFFDDLSSCTVCRKRISNRTKLLQHETACKQKHQQFSKQKHIFK